MNNNYIKKILNDNDNTLLRAMFSIVWNERQIYGDPEENHPNWQDVKVAYDRLCENDNSQEQKNYMDLWTVLECFCETYYLIGLKQGLETNKSILPCVDIMSNPFISDTDAED